jgi:hypothetical protein
MFEERRDSLLFLYYMVTDCLSLLLRGRGGCDRNWYLQLPMQSVCITTNVKKRPSTSSYLKLTCSHNGIAYLALNSNHSLYFIWLDHYICRCLTYLLHGILYRSNRTHFPDLELTSACSFSLVWPDRVSNTRSTTFEANMLIITP